MKAKLNQEFTKPRFSSSKPIIAPVLTSNPQKIGTAFDYLLRFYASYLNSNAISRPWVAETSLKILELSIENDRMIIDPKNRLIGTQNVDQLPREYLKKCKKVKQIYYTEAKNVVNTAKENLGSYLETGNLNDQVIASALALAKLDELKRAGYLSTPQSYVPEKKDVEDLRQLVSIINPETFRARHTCVLNPGFSPKISRLIRADGDLVIDNALIEIKTVKNLKVDRRNFDQLLGYYTMYRIGGIRGMSTDNQINRLGIYFSRHGYLHTYQVEDLINESTYPDFIEWFNQRALDFGPS